MMDAFYVLIGEEIRLARLRRGLTQQAVAEQIGMTKSSVSLLERGRVRPSVQIFTQLCVLLELDPSQVLYEALGLVRQKADGSGQ